MCVCCAAAYAELRYTAYLVFECVNEGENGKRQRVGPAEHWLKPEGDVMLSCSGSVGGQLVLLEPGQGSQQLNRLAKMQQDVLVFVRRMTESGDNGHYHPRRNSHGHWQAGAISFGLRFEYGKTDKWPERKIPPELEELRCVAEAVTGVPYNVVLLKVYTQGEDSLGKHQDVDGSPQSVACFTFASDPRLCRTLRFTRGKSGTKVVAELSPGNGALLHFDGAINSEFSHRVLPVPESQAQTVQGLRVSITCRRVLWEGKKMTCL